MRRDSCTKTACQCPSQRPISMSMTSLPPCPLDEASLLSSQMAPRGLWTVLNPLLYSDLLKCPSIELQRPSLGARRRPRPRSASPSQDQRPTQRLSYPLLSVAGSLSTSLTSYRVLHLAFISTSDASSRVGRRSPLLPVRSATPSACLSASKRWESSFFGVGMQRRIEVHLRRRGRDSASALASSALCSSTVELYCGPSWYCLHLFKAYTIPQLTSEDAREGHSRQNDGGDHKDTVLHDDV